jgi:signal transduction histidine kinase
VTARRERDRQARARLRLVGAAGLASLLVFAFGGVALRRQRKELELERVLAISTLEQASDARLARATRAATLGTLAMGIAHEVATPLGVITGRAEQLLPRQPDERSTQAVKMVLEQAERIGQVIRGFLRLVRGEAPATERVDSADIVTSSVALVEHRLRKAGVECETRAERGLCVRGERRLLEQALVNLLLNACDACGDDGGLVTVETRRAEGFIEIAVEDDGGGISPDDAGRALEPFFTTKPSGEGSGLGLAVASEIVKSHRGTLALRARPAGGTIATVRIPDAGGDHAA